MLIDVEGDVSAGSTDVAIVVMEPNPDSPGLTYGVLQFGFPSNTPWAYVDGTEIWLDPTFQISITTMPNRAFRLALNALPVSATPITAQMVCLLLTPVGGAASCSSYMSASPAIWLNY